MKLLPQIGQVRLKAIEGLETVTHTVTYGVGGGVGDGRQLLIAGR